MKIPNQLPLDFLNGSSLEAESPAVGARVLSLDAARQFKRETVMKSVYERILQSVEHIDSQPPKAMG
jgi:hypothetical protein